MRILIRTIPVLVGLALLTPAFGSDASKPDGDGHGIKYTVSERTVTIISATTSYDSDQKLKEVFLHWFKRGFETALNGSAPLIIEWQDSAEGRAGQRGYDFGRDEADRYRKKEPYQPRQRTPEKEPSSATEPEARRP